MINPKILVTENWINCVSGDLERESGYVHSLFQVKLLKIAQMKDIDPATIKLAWNANTSKFATPKSTNAPTAPTIANLMNRVRSRASLKIDIWVMTAPTAV